MIKKLALSAIVFASSLFAASEVNVYSQRHYDSDKILFKQFEKETGIKVNLVTAKAEELVAKLTIEGANTPADILITADIGNLYQAKERNLLLILIGSTGYISELFWNELKEENSESKIYEELRDKNKEPKEIIDLILDFLRSKS